VVDQLYDLCLERVDVCLELIDEVSASPYLLLQLLGLAGCLVRLGQHVQTALIVSQLGMLVSSHFVSELQLPHEHVHRVAIRLPKGLIRRSQIGLPRDIGMCHVIRAAARPLDLGRRSKSQVRRNSLFIRLDGVSTVRAALRRRSFSGKYSIGLQGPSGGAAANLLQHRLAEGLGGDACDVAHGVEGVVEHEELLARRVGCQTAGPEQARGVPKALKVKAELT